MPRPTAKFVAGSTLYGEMLEFQQGRCAICGADDRELIVDHCHTTGFVRGLLCGPCNRALGLFGDSSIVLESARRYLRVHHRILDSIGLGHRLPANLTAKTALMRLRSFEIPNLDFAPHQRRRRYARKPKPEQAAHAPGSLPR